MSALRDVIIKSGNLRECGRCHMPFKKMSLPNHEKICDKLALRARYLPAIEVGKRNFICPLSGCNVGVLNSRFDMNTHLIECHTAEELQPWGINKNILTGNTAAGTGTAKQPRSAFSTFKKTFQRKKPEVVHRDKSVA